jgi:MFS family permease
VLTQRPHSGQYLDGIFATAPTDIGWLLLGYTVVFGIGVTVWGSLLPKAGARRAMRISLWAMVAVCAALALLNHSTAWPPWGRAVLVAVAALLIMIESGFGPAALTWLAQSLGLEGGVGAAMGIYSVLLSLGALAGSLLGGWTATLWRIDGLLSATVLLAVCALLFLSRLSAAEMPANRPQDLERDHENARV